MPRGNQLSVEEKASIKAYRDANLGIREIARKLQRTPGAIVNFLKNPKTYGTKKEKVVGGNYLNVLKEEFRMKYQIVKSPVTISNEFSTSMLANQLFGEVFDEIPT
ncbi:uncharacterized protein DEA37_0002683 [Paragonimus westermani]|uniref:Tc3 transposase DNA binding domain-containing protein n=1 Tax=Paragonimus westermani TaxID=34504 RepID=A0A5J4N2T5_9TREM|nr:uncharacterized protein DEA37_0002683 [Paragonimus westermani]